MKTKVSLRQVKSESGRETKTAVFYLETVEVVINKKRSEAMTY